MDIFVATLDRDTLHYVERGVTVLLMVHFQPLFLALRVPIVLQGQYPPLLVLQVPSAQQVLQVALRAQLGHMDQAQD